MARASAPVIRSLLDALFAPRPDAVPGLRAILVEYAQLAEEAMQHRAALHRLDQIGLAIAAAGLTVIAAIFNTTVFSNTAERLNSAALVSAVTAVALALPTFVYAEQRRALDRIAHYVVCSLGPRLDGYAPATERPLLRWEIFQQRDRPASCWARLGNAAVLPDPAVLWPLFQLVALIGSLYFGWTQLWLGDDIVNVARFSALLSLFAFVWSLVVASLASRRSRRIREGWPAMLSLP